MFPSCFSEERNYEEVPQTNNKAEKIQMSIGKIQNSTNLHGQNAKTRTLQTNEQQNVRILEHPLHNFDSVAIETLDVLTQLRHCIWCIVMFVLSFKRIGAERLQKLAVFSPLVTV